MNGKINNGFWRMVWTIVFIFVTFAGIVAGWTTLKNKLEVNASAISTIQANRRLKDVENDIDKKEQQVRNEKVSNDITAINGKLANILSLLQRMERKNGK